MPRPLRGGKFRLGGELHLQPAALEAQGQLSRLRLILHMAEVRRVAEATGGGTAEA